MVQRRDIETSNVLFSRVHGSGFGRQETNMATPGSQRPAPRDLVRRVGMSGNYWYAVEQENAASYSVVADFTGAPALADTDFLVIT